MTIRLAINGFGRIGRCVLRALYEEKRWDDVQVVAINTLGDLETNAHLLRYDTTHGSNARALSVRVKRLPITSKAARRRC